jgi:uncharacterized protein (DUF58 family)
MDLRHLDWRAVGRTDRLVIKRFQAETELPCTVILDLSGDLSTGSSGRGGYPALDTSKAGYAITLAATLVYWLYRHGEPIGLELLAGETSARSFAPHTGRNHLQRMFIALASAHPGGVAGLHEALVRVGSRVRRRSWVGVISDGMEEPSRWLPALGAFARRGADTRFLHLFDRREWRLDYARAAQFYSPEGGPALPVDPSGAGSAFEEVVREYVEEVRGAVVRWGGRYIQVPTDRPMEEAILRVAHGAATRLEAP